jgi:preprotein translocase subunit SecE
MFNKVLQFIQEVRIELVKVTWPSREEIIGSTGVVLIFAVIMAIFIGAFDLFLSKIVAMLVK